MIQTANDRDFESKVHSATGTVVVDFSATYCSPCKEQARVLARFVTKHPEVRVYEVDVEEAPRIAAQYGVRAMPTLLVFENGALESRVVGLQSDARLEKLLAR